MAGNVACAKRDRSKMMVFIKCDNAENRILFFSFSSLLYLVICTFETLFIPLKQQEAGAHTIPAFFVSKLFFPLVSGFNSKIYSFILHRSSFFWLLWLAHASGCANAEFISWNNNLLHWKHVRRLCSHIAYLVLVPPSKSLDWQPHEFFDAVFWHLNRMNENSWCVTAKREAHQILSGEQQKTWNSKCTQAFSTVERLGFWYIYNRGTFQINFMCCSIFFLLRFLFMRWELKTEKDNWWERRRYDNNHPISSILC